MTDLVELRGHTPGPWEVHQGNGIVRKCEGEVCQVIADMRAPYKHGIGIVRGEQQQWANARLIAKAPELLDRIETLEAEITELRAENARLSKAVCSEILNELLSEDETEALVAFVKELRAQSQRELGNQPGVRMCEPKEWT